MFLVLDIEYSQFHYSTYLSCFVFSW